MHTPHTATHKARHATPYNAHDARAAAARSAEYQPRHAAPEVVVVLETGHGIHHGDYPADVTR